MPFVYVCMSWVEMVIGDISVGQVCIGTHSMCSTKFYSANSVESRWHSFAPKHQQVLKSLIPDSYLDTHGCLCNQQKEPSNSKVLALKWVTMGESSHGEVCFESGVDR